MDDAPRKPKAMIRYALKCAEGHTFDSWFQSADAFDRLAGAGHLSCSVCGGGGVEKRLMAPRIGEKTATPDAPPKPPGPLTQPATPAEQAMAELRRKIEAEATYVGESFATEARKMHEGETPHRHIYGETRPAEARKLIEDGVPIAPLPFVPRRQTN